ncbi:hypothetical protein [Vibrio crassostreae]|uniref:hypothetical protein n=1 Tax=Vibrio crassostreae TaxID=246167 RepID=UPI001B30ED6E|nr:hypothetical protein [Vibrio crassostreae]
MKKGIFLDAFDKVRDLVTLDKSIDAVEWDVMGGEPTLMPYEWWAEMLPLAIAKVREVNKLTRRNGFLMFTSNFTFDDDRYVGLFNKMSKYPEFYIFTSWEPDTNRFGRSGDKFQRFKENLKRVNCSNITLNLVMTKETCATNPRFIVDTFLPLGVTDISTEQLSPFGSGKRFYVTNNAEQGAIVGFLKGLRDALPEGFPLSPLDEMKSSLHGGSSFCCNGNYKYDLSIEPDGLTTFNSCKTGSEGLNIGDNIYVTDTTWANTVLLKNIHEEFNKINTQKLVCNQCDYMRFCNGGWYHGESKILSDVSGNLGSCTGYKNLWDEVKKDVVESNVTSNIHKQEIESIARQHSDETIAESSLYRQGGGLIEALVGVSEVVVDCVEIGSMPLVKRLLLYKNMGLKVQLAPKFVENDKHVEMLIRLILTDSLGDISIDCDQMWVILLEHIDSPELNSLKFVLHETLPFIGYSQAQFTDGFNRSFDYLHDEFTRWVLSNPPSNIEHRRLVKTDLIQSCPERITQIKGHLGAEAALLELLKPS